MAWISPRLAAYGLALAVLVGSLYASYRWAYGRGEAARDAHYAPILAAAERARTEAEARVAVQERFAARITARLEEEHARELQTVSDRARALESRYRDVRLCSAEARPGGDEVPGIPGATPEPDGSGPEPSGDGRIGPHLVRIAERCEHDARQLTALQRWIVEQREAYEAGR